jgi:hypothetical protein
MAPKMTLSLACLAQACGSCEKEPGRKAEGPERKSVEIRVPFQAVLVPGFAPAASALPSLFAAGGRRH